MQADDRLDRPAPRQRAVLARVLVIGIVLAAFGYGMARMTAHSPASLAVAAAAGPAGLAAVATHTDETNDRVLREEEPRPCEPERGVTERCTY